jgi:hypothetical protein
MADEGITLLDRVIELHKQQYLSGSEFANIKRQIL